MAQASSAQREPSMEEILASIRRIIEDSETGYKDEGPEAGSVSANDAGASEAPRPEPEPALAAQLEQAAGEEEAQEVKVEEKPAPRAFEWMRHGTDEKVSFAADASDTPPASARQDEADTTSGTRADTGSHDASGEERQAQSLAPVSPARPSGSVEQGILSQTPGRKVAAAFEELNETFEASRRKSLGDAAEEMLRPMLQEWLDNNLPQLVEKLVREEIERIARGA